MKCWPRKQKWVVDLYRPLKRGKRETERLLVQAGSREGAIRTARFYSVRRLRLVATARLANHEDLGCVPIPRIAA